MVPNDRASSSSSDGSRSEFPLVQAGSTLLLLTAIYSLGLKSSILIFISAGLLLLNPWIRILLELPSSSSSPKRSNSSLSRFDPAYYLSSFHSKDESQPESEQVGKFTEPTSKSTSVQRKLSLSGLPPLITSRLKITVPLLVRDFVKYWYDPLTFAHPAFPSEASATIEHLCGSVYTRVKKKRTVDVASNLLLTSSSVILSALRARRTEGFNDLNSNSTSNQPRPPAANPSLPPIHSWNSTSSRIQSLRISLHKFLSIHLPSDTSSSPLVLSVVTEILVKQLWGIVQVVGDPDWINQKIVESSIEKEDGSEPQVNSTPAVGLGLESNGVKSPELDVDPLADRELLKKAQLEANMNMEDQEKFTQRTQPQFRDQMKTGGDQSIGSSGSLQRTSSPKPMLPDRPIQQSQSSLSGSHRNSSEQPLRSGSNDPLTSLGNLGLSALGSVGKAAGKTMGVIEGAVDEVGNTIMGGEATISNRNGSSSSLNQPDPQSKNFDQRRKPAPLINFDDEPTIKRPPSNWNSDLPTNDSGIQEPQLPQSLIDSMKERKSIDGYEIGEPEQGRENDVPTLPPRTPVLSSSTDHSFDSSRFPPLTSVLRRESPELYDRFESFLENRSSSSSNEGETLLRLHTQIQTLAQISEMSSPDEPTFVNDALAILEKVRTSLSPGSELSLEMEKTVSKLQVDGNGSMRSLDGLKEKVHDGLQRLYHLFCQRQQEKLDQDKPSNSSSIPATPSNLSTRPSAPSSVASNASAQRSNSPGLNYVTRGSVPKAQPEAPVPLSYTPRKKSSNFPSATTPSTLDPSSSAIFEQRQSSMPPPPPPRPQSSLSQVSRPSEAENDVQPSKRISLDQSSAHPGTPTSSSRTSSEQSTRPPSIEQPSSSPSPILSLEVSITDVSPSSNGPNSFIDPRSLELMVAVEGMAASGGGFVLVRRWVEFEGLDLELRRSQVPRSTVPQLPNLKSKTSMAACQLIESYLIKLLANPVLFDLEATKRFVDKTRAGATAESEAVKAKGGPKAFISGMGAFGGTLGRSVAIGASSVGAAVGNVGKTAGQKSGLVGLERDNSASSRNSDALSTKLENLSSLSVSSSTSSSPTSSPSMGLSKSSESNAQLSNSNPALASPQLGAEAPSSELSAQDLDALLSAVFSVADEAFDLSGGWTFRRGMLRVLEQIVRASYGTTIINAFNHTAQSLSSESLGNHLEGLTDSFWPIQKGEDGQLTSSELSNRVWDSTPSPSRTLEEREKTSREARMVVLSYAPTQAAYLLGPGGKQSCERALSAIHQTVEHPITALDLGLTIVLRVLEISCE